MKSIQYSEKIKEFKHNLIEESTKASPIRYKNKMDNLLYSYIFRRITLPLSEQMIKDIYEKN